jgi:general stress protein 26
MTMDSINRQQTEENRDDLTATDAVAKIKEITGKAKTCFFCTSTPAGGIDGRPMAVQQVDDLGNLWFLSSDDSHKNAALAADASVTLFFQGSAHSDFLVIDGTATVSKDKNKIHELWEPIIKTWFTGGEDDPRITVIKVAPTGGYYWDTKHGSFVAGVKMMIGAALGRTMDDSIEGKINVA